MDPTDYMPLAKMKTEEIIEKLKRIALTTEHEDILEAILADLGDALPIVGDIGNLFKSMDAVKKDKTMAIVLQSIDFVGGLIPVVGDIFDLITPTNTILFLEKDLKLLTPKL